MKYLKLAAVLIAASVMTGCEGQGTSDPLDPGNGGNGGETGEVSIQLIADKTEVEADGLDCVTFRVVRTDGSGQEEELHELYPRAVRIMDAETGEALPFKTFATTSVKNKEVEYVAVYEETESDNTVTVKFSNREKYEKYFQKVAVVELTGTWCTGCPAMVNAIKNVDDDISEHMVVMALHSSSSYADDHLEPVTNNTLGKDILQAFDSSSIPNCIYDLNEINHVSTKANVGNIVYSYLANHYATCGVRVVSSSLEDKTLKITAAMTSDKGGDYDLGWALVADGFRYDGGTLESGIYDDVLIATSDNFYKMSSGRFTAEADKEVEKEFISELPSLPNGFDASKARVVVFALSRLENDYTSVIVDNITECPVGEGNDYILN